MDFAALATELNTDPKALGFAALIAAKNDQGCADLLNRASGAGAQSVFRNDIAPREIIQAIAAADFTAATQLQISKLSLMLASAPIDATLANVRANLQGIFSGASAATTNALTAVASRTGSRAEVLLGVGTVVGWQDVAKALGRS